MQRHQPCRVGQDLVLLLHHLVGRQAAILHRQAHRPARGVEAEAEFARGGDLGADQVAGAARMQVQVVGGGGAAAQGKLAQAHPGGYVRRLLVEAAPHRIQGAQPGEQVAGQCRGERTRQVLVQVVVGVDQARRHQAAGRVDHSLRRRLPPRRPQRADHAVADRHPAARNLTAVGVHRHQQFCTAHAQVGAFVALRLTHRHWYVSRTERPLSTLPRQPHLPGAGRQRAECDRNPSGAASRLPGRQRLPVGPAPSARRSLSSGAAAACGPAPDCGTIMAGTASARHRRNR